MTKGFNKNEKKYSIMPFYEDSLKFFLGHVLPHASGPLLLHTSYHRAPGGGGPSVLKVTGTCRWTGYDFAVINISTGYLVALLQSSILAQGILWPSCGHQYWHRVSKSA